MRQKGGERDRVRKRSSKGSRKSRKRATLAVLKNARIMGPGLQRAVTSWKTREPEARAIVDGKFSERHHQGRNKRECISFVPVGTTPTQCARIPPSRC